VNGSCRVGLRHVFVIAVIACALAACGVKGDLELPPTAKLAEPQAKEQAPTQAASAEPRVFTEQSRVQRAPTPSVIPRMPPEEWSRSREYQSTSQPRSRDKQKSKTDEPFFLDPIL
jgi:predicted small lipoprotein YifL